MTTRQSLLGCALGVALAALAASSAGAVTYAVNQTIGGGSVTGTITTDGATGVLSAADITAWTLDLNGVGASFSIDNTNSFIDLVGGDVTATASDLFFDYSGGDDGFLLFQQVLFSGAHYYCDATSSGTCFQGATVTPQTIFDPSAQHVAERGKQIIGTAAGGVPEPASWALMIVGLGSLGAVLRGRRSGARLAGILS